MIETKDLKISFGELKVLKGITQTIKQGEKVVIIGPSGSGKSTFLRCLNLLETPDSGSILFEGNDITSKNADINLVRRQMGMVFQHFNLFPHLTVLKNITLAPVKLKLLSQNQADEKAMELLERIGLADKADVYPSTLSGGQKQRIAIVRSLAMSPSVTIINRYRKGQREVFALVVAKLRGKPIVLPFLREILIIVGRNAATERE